jgi:hypothetical protein
MKELEDFLQLVVKAHRDGIPLQQLRAELCKDMSPEEVNLLLEVVVQEIRKEK